MSSGELRLINPDLPVARYAEQNFGLITSENHIWQRRIGHVMSAVIESMRPNHAVNALQWLSNLYQLADRLDDTAVDRDIVLRDQIALRQLEAAFGTPDESSDLVMSVVLLFQAHRRRLEELAARAEAALTAQIARALERWQAMIDTLNSDEARQRQTRDRLLLELESSNSAVIDENVAALEQTALSKFAQGERVSELRHRRATKLDKVRRRLVQTNQALEHIMQQKISLGQAVQGLINVPLGEGAKG